ncbi:MAG: ATP-dependent sacrificial sulfur transferase LarE [Deltaproteobacteria bacterium]|nr:ATP-dependent sacrificial sulfur transferase LarE [Deltaproteobacteria bacterium]
MRDIAEKKAQLVSVLSGMDSLLAAFSGGVDSTLLTAVAAEVLGDNLLAVTACSAVHPRREIRNACETAQRLGVRHMTIRSGEMADLAFKRNRPDRCYRCKTLLFRRLLEIAADNHIEHVAHGANVDDLQDYRPGFRAAEELHIRAPLVDAGFTKADIRALAREMGLDAWDKPAMACLASRIPYGTVLTVEALAMVEKAEALLQRLGFRHCRVRHHGSVARIEIPASELPAVIGEAVAPELVRGLKAIGFDHVAVDLEGYTQGSMNRGIAS